MQHRLARTAVLALAAAAALLPAGAGAQSVPQLLSGRVLAADGGEVAGARVILRSAARADTAAADSAGRFSLPLPAAAAGDSVELRVEPAGGAEARHHPAAVRVARAELPEQPRLVLLPRTWTITSGAHAGETVEISPERAFRGACRGCSGFYRLAPLAAGAQDAFRPVLSWPHRTFPLRLAFDRANSGEPVQARDSAAFWQVVDRMEAEFGVDLFRPARFLETVGIGDRDPDDVVLVWIEPGLRNPGLTTLSTFRGEIRTGSVWLKRTSLIGGYGGTALVTHELMHALGLGHTCAWRSVLADLGRCPGLDAPAPTAEDVAYTQLLLRARELQRTGGARWGIEAALEAARPGAASLAAVANER